MTESGLSFPNFKNRLYIIYTCDIKGDTQPVIQPVEGLVGAFYVDNLVKDIDGTVLISSMDINRTNANKGEDWFTNDYISGYRANYVIEEMELDVTP